MIKIVLVGILVHILMWSHPIAASGEDPYSHSNLLGPKSLFETKEDSLAPAGEESRVGALIHSGAVVISAGISRPPQMEVLGGGIAHDRSA